MLKLGTTGDAVDCWQRALGQPATGLFSLTTDAATRAFQEAHGLTPDGIVGPKSWAAASGLSIITGEAMATTAPRTGAIHYVIVHHSDTATRAGMVRALNSPKRKNPASTHYSVDKDGSIHCHADPLEVVTWHCPGVNLHGIGVDVIHRHGEAFTEAQTAATGRLLRWLCKVHGLPLLALEGRQPVGKGQLGAQAWGVAGHGQLRATLCPDGFDVAGALNAG